MSNRITGGTSQEKPPSQAASKSILKSTPRPLVCPAKDETSSKTSSSSSTGGDISTAKSIMKSHVDRVPPVCKAAKNGGEKSFTSTKPISKAPPNYTNTIGRDAEQDKPPRRSSTRVPSTERDSDRLEGKTTLKYKSTAKRDLKTTSRATPSAKASSPALGGMKSANKASPSTRSKESNSNGTKITTPEDSRAPRNTKSLIASSIDQEMAKRQVRYDTLSPAEKSKQDKWAQKQIQRWRGCPVGWPWTRFPSKKSQERDSKVGLKGYRCFGGGETHLMTDEQVAEGKGGFYNIFLQDDGTLDTVGPWYPDPAVPDVLLYCGEGDVESCQLNEKDLTDHYGNGIGIPALGWKTRTRVDRRKREEMDVGKKAQMIRGS